MVLSSHIIDYTHYLPRSYLSRLQGLSHVDDDVRYKKPQGFSYLEERLKPPMMTGEVLWNKFYRSSEIEKSFGPLTLPSVKEITNIEDFIQWFYRCFRGTDKCLDLKRFLLLACATNPAVAVVEICIVDNFFDCLYIDGSEKLFQQIIKLKKQTFRETVQNLGSLRIEPNIKNLKQAWNYIGRNAKNKVHRAGKGLQREVYGITHLVAELSGVVRQDRLNHLSNAARYLWGLFIHHN